MMNNIAYYRNLVILAGLAPLLLLGWDAWNEQLGANGVTTRSISQASSPLFLVYLSGHYSLASANWLEQHHRLPTSAGIVWFRLRCNPLRNLCGLGSNGERSQYCRRDRFATIPHGGLHSSRIDATAGSDQY